MAKKVEIDVDKIIATNPKIDRNALERGAEVLRKLEKTGAVKPSAYSLETPDSRKSIKYCVEE